jgi:hypothetical protein
MLHTPPIGQQLIERAGDGLKVGEETLGYGCLLMKCRAYAIFWNSTQLRSSSM